MNSRRLRSALSLALCISSLTLLLLHLSPPVHSAGVIYYVDADAGGMSDGLTWATAYTSVQSALSSVTFGDQIWIAEGVYKPGAAGDRTSTFTIPNGVKVYGGFAGGEGAVEDRDPAANASVLSGDIDGNDTVDSDGVTTTATFISGSNAYHVVTVSGVGSATVLDGVIITGGDARTATGSPNNYGGGLNGASSAVSAGNLRIVGNAAVSGGGAYLNGGPATLSEVVFENNLAVTAGGGMLVQNGSGEVLTHLAFRGNAAKDGGAMATYNSALSLDTVAMYGNSASDRGGGVFVYGGSPVLSGVSIAGNSALTGGAFYNTSSATSVISNAIFWGNTATTSPEMHVNNGSPTVSYSTIGGCGGSGVGTWNSAMGSDGGGNRDADPLFVDLSNGDLRLSEGSPAIDAGLDTAVPAGVTTDLAGSPRFVDGNSDGTPTVDMGAFEYGVSDAVTLTVGSVDATQGATVHVPVGIALAGTEVYAADLVLTYDSTRLTATGVALGSAASGWLLEYNILSPGEIRAHLAGANALPADGELVELVYAAGAGEGYAAIAWAEALLNEGGVTTTLVDGGVMVVLTAGADFAAAPASGPAPLTVTFTCLGTGGYDTCAWDYGDTATGTGTNPSHTYQNPGVYTVSVTVSGPGGSDTETKAGYITVYAPAVAGFTASVVDGLALLDVAFTDTSTGDYDSWFWAFGDGGTSIVQNPTHTYASAGTYTVSLTVSGNGGTSTETKTDLINVRTGEISGTVRYWMGARALRDVSVALSGDISGTAATDGLGAYGFSGLHRGAYAVTPGEGASVGDAISPYDASLALRHAAGLITLDAYALQAAEVTLNGIVTAYDASHILRAAAGTIPLASPNAGVAWQFDPESRSYTGYEETVTGQDYVAVLLGDVSGNWGGGGDPTALAPPPLAVLEWQVGPADASGIVTATLALVSTEAPVYSFTLDLRYDSSVHFGGAWVGEGTSNWLVASNPEVAGGSRLVMAGAQPVETPGTLARLVYQLPVGMSRLEMVPSAAELDEGTVAVRWHGQGDDYRLYLPLVRR